MGNYIPIDFCFLPFYNKENPPCFICKKKIDSCDLVTCVRCKITLHYLCEEKQNYEGKNKYTKCPNCHRLGCLGISFEK
jgi:hypothetical protein